MGGAVWQAFASQMTITNLKNRIIEFKTLTSKANELIQSHQSQPTASVATESQETIVEESSSIVTESSPVVEETVDYFTAEELNDNYTKKNLLALAKSLGITLPPSGKRKAQMVEFLAGKIQK